VSGSESPRRSDEGLAGRLAVVTGAGHGIGLAVAQELRARGSRVIAVDKDESLFGEDISSVDYVPVLGDLASDDVIELADALVAEHGPIPLIVNNVGVSTPHTFLQLEPSDFDLVFRTNLRGPWFFTRQLVRTLIDDKSGGAIVFVSSVHDTFVRLQPHYSSTKAAIAMLVKELALELAPYSIRVNAVSPGWIKTEEEVPPERERALTERIPAGRPGLALDVALAIVGLLNDEWSRYVTGTNVRVDGGLSLHSWVEDLPPYSGAG
jgi:NAD(P)-dependent dehydrogenase (short-subunit alcohol dehydrogenase family)